MEIDDCGGRIAILPESDDEERELSGLQETVIESDSNTLAWFTFDGADYDFESEVTVNDAVLIVSFDKPSGALQVYIRAICRWFDGL